MSFKLDDEVHLILDAIHEDLLLTDANGRVIKVSPTFEKFYGIKEKKALGMTVYELEEKGFFKPSIVAVALKKKEKVTMQQRNNRDRDILVTATPVFDEYNKIKFVVSYSRDITEIIKLEKQYYDLENKVEKYEAEIDQLRKEQTDNTDIICQSKAFKDIIITINQIASFDASVLITGPSGVGKTMIAKEIHRLSNRSEAPLVDINCAAIPDALLESELFGYEKGAFTGANTKGKIGLIELADGGTLLLDEISEMSLNLQAKLLKTIQDKVIHRVGGTESKAVDFRLIVATNQDMEKLINEGTFRKDLYYRLNVVNIDIPPLKKREKDIIPLCHHFLEKFNKKYNTNKKFQTKAFEAFVNYSWPGNIREIANVIERAVVTCDGDLIKAEAVPNDDVKNVYNSGKEYNSLADAIERYEAEIIKNTYEKYGSSVEVARVLKISQPTAHRKIVKYIRE